MTNDILLKVYNKKGKLKLSIRDSRVIKTISIYKYNGENTDTHSFTIAKGDYKLKSWQAYYELQVESEGGMREGVTISSGVIESYEYFNDLSLIKTTTNLKSGNVYEKRIKIFKGEKYESEFKNNELTEFGFRLQENKINEYLETLQHGK